MNATRLLLVLLVISAFCGCGDGISTAPVSGVVTWEGEPVQGGFIVTQPEFGPQATSPIDDQGRFTLESGDRGGAVVCRHKVFFSAPPLELSDEEKQKRLTMRNPPPLPEIEWDLPSTYFSPDTSGLEFEVGSSGNEWKIELPE